MFCLYLCSLLFSLPLHSMDVKRDYVLLVYMNGSNLESRGQMATSNIGEICHSMTQDSLNNHVAVVILMGGTKQWHLYPDISSEKIPEDSITISLVTGKGFKKIHTEKCASIGSPSTLSAFINYSVKEFPSDRYGLIFWNHGAGAVTGFGYDELYPSDRSLSLAEIQEGLQETVPNLPKFDFIGFDACLMSTLETASAISTYADYMIASQELEPASGWNYSDLISQIKRSPTIMPSELGKTIVDAYIAKSGERSQSTLSVINLAKVPALTSLIGESSHLLENKLIQQTSVADIYQNILLARMNTKAFGMPSFTFYGPDMVDALDFWQQISSKVSEIQIAGIKQQLHETVIYSKTSDDLKNAEVCGLSLYFPYYNMTMAGSLSEYNQSRFDTDYLKLVNTFSKELIAGHSGRGTIEIYKKDSVSTLSTEMILNTRKIYSIILQEKENNRWLSYGLDGDGITLDMDGNIVKKDLDDHVLEVWNQKWIGIGGKLVSAYMTLSSKEGLVYTVPALLNSMRVDLIIKYDELNPSGLIYGARRIIDANIPDKGLIELHANDTLTFLHESFPESENAEFVPTDTIILKKRKDLKVNIIQVPPGKYQYGYCLVDIYGGKHYTKFRDMIVQ